MNQPKNTEGSYRDHESLRKNNIRRINEFVCFLLITLFVILFTLITAAVFYYALNYKSRLIRCQVCPSIEKNNDSVIRVFVRSTNNETDTTFQCSGTWITESHILIPKDCRSNISHPNQNETYFFDEMYNIAVVHVYMTPNQPKIDDSFGLIVLEVKHNISSNNIAPVCLPIHPHIKTNKSELLFPSFKEIGAVSLKDLIVNVFVDDLEDEPQKETYFLANNLNLTHTGDKCQEIHRGIDFYVNTPDGYVLAGISSSDYCSKPVKFVRIVYYINWLNSFVYESRRSKRVN